VDEVQNFTTDGFAAMLSEARKYGLSLVLASQHLSAVASEVRDAVLGNVGTIISFRVSDSDAQILSREFGGDFVPAQFTQLANHEVLVRLVHRLRLTTPFRARTLAPLPLPRGRRDTLVRRTREKYGARKSVVEGRIRRWMQS
jgi:hypothetical protein